MAFKDQEHKNLIKLMKGVINETLPVNKLDTKKFLDVNFRKSSYMDYVTCTDDRQSCFGGKRAGKSAANAGKIVWADQFVCPEKPGYLLYASPTAEQSQKLSLKRLHQVQTKYKFRWKYKLSTNMIVTENNNIIQFIGLKDLQSVNKIQGLPVKCCIVDEAQLIREDVLVALIRDVVSMGMADFHGQGFCVLTGNPSPVHSGFCWEFKNNPEFTHFRFNFLDNPFYTLEYKKDFLSKELKRRNETPETMSNASKRLLYGEEVEDLDKVVMRFSKENFFTEIKDKEDLYCICGVDLGYDDKTAMAVLYYDFEKDIIYVDEEYQEKHLSLDAVVLKLKDLLSRHNTEGRNIIDTQGGGKQTAISISVDYKIPIIPAKKADKMHYVALMRSYAKENRLKIRKSSHLLVDCKHLIFKPHFLDLDDGYFHSDIFHAVLYGFSFLYKKFKLETKKSTQLSRMEQIIEGNKTKVANSINKDDYFID